MDIQDVLSRNIRNYIKAKGLKQKSVAENCNLDEKVFSNMLCGRQEIRTEHLALIAQALDININDLFKIE